MKRTADFRSAEQGQTVQTSNKIQIKQRQVKYCKNKANIQTSWDIVYSFRVKYFKWLMNLLHLVLFLIQNLKKSENVGREKLKCSESLQTLSHVDPTSSYPLSQWRQDQYWNSSVVILDGMLLRSEQPHSHRRRRINAGAAVHHFSSHRAKHLHRRDEPTLRLPKRRDGDVMMMTSVSSRQSDSSKFPEVSVRRADSRGELFSLQTLGELKTLIFRQKCDEESVGQTLLRVYLQYFFPHISCQLQSLRYCLVI